MANVPLDNRRSRSPQTSHTPRPDHLVESNLSQEVWSRLLSVGWFLFFQRRFPKRNPIFIA